MQMCRKITDCESTNPTLSLKRLGDDWDLGLLRVRRDVEDADAVAAEVSARYCITYRTLANDLSVPG